MAQAMVEPNCAMNSDAVCTHSQQGKVSGAVLEFYDLVTELTLEQMRQRNAKRKIK